MSCKSIANYYHGFDSTVESINLPLPDLPGHLFLSRHITTRSNSINCPLWLDRPDSSTSLLSRAPLNCASPFQYPLLHYLITLNTLFYPFSTSFIIIWEEFCSTVFQGTVSIDRHYHGVSHNIHRIGSLSLGSARVFGFLFLRCTRWLGT
jgi:hypothetical protein